MKIKINHLTVLFILLFFSAAHTQDMGQINFIHSLDNKSIATYGDAVKLFTASSGGSTGNFASESAWLNEQGIALNYSEDAPLQGVWQHS